MPMGRTALTLTVILLLASCGEGASPRPVSNPDVYLAPDTTVSRGLVPDKTTMDALLRAHGLGADAVQGVVIATQSVFDPRRLRSLQPFALERTLDGALRLFEYEIDADSFLRIVATRDADDRLRAEVLPIPKTLEHATAAGRIDAATPVALPVDTGRRRERRSGHRDGRASFPAKSISIPSCSRAIAIRSRSNGSGARAGRPRTA